MFIDHGTRMKVKGTEVTGYDGVAGSTTARLIRGKFSVDGKASGTYEVLVDDRGEPGREDSFVLSLNGAEPAAAAGFLDGGNIQLHTCK